MSDPSTETTEAAAEVAEITEPPLPAEEALGEGEAPAEPPGTPESTWSPEVAALAFYFDEVVTVHLRFPIAMLDLSEVGQIFNPQKQKPQLIAILAPAVFVRQTQDDPPVIEKLPPRATDVLENVVLSAAPCGQRIMITQRTRGTHAGDIEAFQEQSGAVLSHMVFPKDIAVITRLQSPPDMTEPRPRAPSEPSRLVTL